MIQTGIKIACVLFVCCMIAGCSDYAATNSRSHRTHYSDLIHQKGEPAEIVSGGAGCKIFSWSPLPIDEAMQNDSPWKGHDIYYVDRDGYVYP